MVEVTVSSIHGTLERYSEGTGNPVIEKLSDLQKIAEILVSKFGSSFSAWVIEASDFNGPFAVYNDFVPSNASRNRILRLGFQLLWLLSLSYRIASKRHLTFDFIISCSKILVVKDIEFLCVVLWRIVEEKSGGSWGIYSAGGKHYWPAAVISPPWCSPAHGLFKVNMDVAVSGRHNRIGIGVVGRNHSGLVMGSSLQSISACFSPQVAEAMAILRGIRFATLICVESDAKVVVGMINGGVAPLADIGLVVQDILSFVRRFLISISFASRRVNLVAHSLAQLALSWLMIYFCWSRFLRVWRFWSWRIVQDKLCFSLLI
ncbi:hypothetical protein Q3G72_032435 [Acer saccharum]|nr:hypothetical protein Q3G72_032435 [Acer saccharum]